MESIDGFDSFSKYIDSDKYWTPFYRILLKLKFNDKLSIFVIFEMRFSLICNNYLSSIFALEN